jgi:hypothetical protein
MDLPGYDLWKTTPPVEGPCFCGEPECDECQGREAQEDAYWRHVDQAVDEAREREWDRR